MLLFSPTVISWENSQNTDIALHTMKENASFGTGLHLGYCFDVKKDYYLHKLKHCNICFCGAFCQRDMVDDNSCQKVSVDNPYFKP